MRRLRPATPKHMGSSMGSGGVGLGEGAGSVGGVGGVDWTEREITSAKSASVGGNGVTWFGVLVGWVALFDVCLDGAFVVGDWGDESEDSPLHLVVAGLGAEAGGETGDCGGGWVGAGGRGCGAADGGGAGRGGGGGGAKEERMASRQAVWPKALAYSCWASLTVCTRVWPR